tara:strand:- start:182 stop:379 length:198 start_codon:yes stop_codon:yes gene_type:complete
MTAFARVITKSWIARLRVVSSSSKGSEIANHYKRDSLQLPLPDEARDEQNKRFFEASKNGGIWFS